jgi:hypothetical protein
VSLSLSLSPPPPHQFYRHWKHYVVGKIMKALSYKIPITLLAWVDITCRSLLQIWILNSWGTYVCLRILFKGTSRICELELIIAWKIDDFWILLNENLNTNVRMSWEISFYMLKVFVSTSSSYLSMCTITWCILNDVLASFKSARKWHISRSFIVWRVKRRRAFVRLLMLRYRMRLWKLAYAQVPSARQCTGMHSALS